MCNEYSTYCRRPGLTLIEVVTALAILSTLLVSMLVAFKKNADRIRAQLAVREATAGVEQLLMNWAGQGSFPPARAHGTLPSGEGFTWETRLVSRQLRATLALDIVRLEVRRADARNPSVPMLAIDLPVPAGADHAQGGPGP